MVLVGWLKRCLAAGVAALFQGPAAVTELTDQKVACPVCSADEEAPTFDVSAPAYSLLPEHVKTEHPGEYEALDPGENAQLASLFALFGLPEKRQR